MRGVTPCMRSGSSISKLTSAPPWLTWSTGDESDDDSDIMMIICRIILAEDRLKKHKTQQPHLAEIEQSYAHRNLRSV